MLQLGRVSWGNQLHVQRCEPGAPPRHGLLSSPAGCRAMKLPSITGGSRARGSVGRGSERRWGCVQNGDGGDRGWGTVCGGALGICWVMGAQQKEPGHRRSHSKCGLGKPRSALHRGAW